jgi:hypothetical protein
MSDHDSSSIERKDGALRRVRDEDLMRRFLVSDVSEAEREQVERQVAEDREYFEELCALESDMIVAYLQGRLPREWHERFEQSVLASPARRREVEEQRAIRSTFAAIEAQRAREERRAPEASSRTSRWPAPTMRLAMAAVLLLAAAGLTVYRLAPRGNHAAPTTRGQLDPRQMTFVLNANQTRSPGQAANIFRAPSSEATVRLEMRVVAEALTAPEVTLQSVGGPIVDGPAVPEVEASSAGAFVVSREIDGGRLPAGDYLLTLTATSAGGERIDVASRFFSVE